MKTVSLSASGTYLLNGVVYPLTPICHCAPDGEAVAALLDRASLSPARGGQGNGSPRGNITRQQRLPYNFPGRGITLVPGLTGNPFRSKLRRLVGTEYLNIVLEGYDPRGASSAFRSLLYTILSGGVKQSGASSKGSESNFYYLALDVIGRLYAHIPTVGLLGGVVNGTFVPGCLSSGFAVPLVRELKGDPLLDQHLDLLLEKVGMDEDSLVSLEDYISAVENAAIAHARGIFPEMNGLVVESPMPFKEEVLPARYPLWHNYIIEPLGEFKDLDGRDVRELFKDTLLAGIKLMADNGFLGAKRALGEGRVMYVYVQEDGSEPDLEGAYNRLVSYFERHRGEIKEYLTAAVFDEIGAVSALGQCVEGNIGLAQELVSELKAAGSTDEMLNVVLGSSGYRELLRDMAGAMGTSQSKRVAFWFSSPDMKAEDRPAAGEFLKAFAGGIKDDEPDAEAIEQAFTKAFKSGRRGRK